MTPEELLRPRYKVIADYPGNAWEVGLVIPSEYHAIKIITDNMIAFYDKYPHLFRKLEWWEERNIEDMPGYVKDEAKMLKVTRHFTGRSALHANKWFNAGDIKGKRNDTYLIDYKLPKSFIEVIGKIHDNPGLLK